MNDKDDDDPSDEDYEKVCCKFSYNKVYLCLYLDLYICRGISSEWNLISSESIIVIHFLPVF